MVHIRKHIRKRIYANRERPWTSRWGTIRPVAEGSLVSDYSSYDYNGWLHFDGRVRRRQRHPLRAFLPAGKHDSEDCIDARFFGREQRGPVVARKGPAATALDTLQKPVYLCNQ